LKAGLWLRRGRLVKMILLFRHLCRAQAKIPLNELSKFAGPLLLVGVTSKPVHDASSASPSYPSGTDENPIQIGARRDQRRVNDEGLVTCRYCFRRSLIPPSAFQEAFYCVSAAWMIDLQAEIRRLSGS
jgi:hypothetical protein